jgi:5-methyltetrahydropteroyltriglutamate--homocysteine methyltransferase
MELRDFIDVMLAINAGPTLSGATQHEHDYPRLRAGQAAEADPNGVITHTTNLVEHPELVAERIVRFARLWAGRT